MEGLQGPINPCFHGDCFDGGDALDFSYLQLLIAENTASEMEEPFSNPSLQGKMPFLQTLGGLKYSPFPSATSSNFHLLLKMHAMQKKNQWKSTNAAGEEPQIPPLELESCITHVSESLSPGKSETRDRICPHSAFPPFPEALSPASNRQSDPAQKCSKIFSSPHALAAEQPPLIREKRKRKRARPSKNSSEIEKQRMTHIAVERNRRKQMNEHLNTLRSLMPTSFVLRGDQASIVGGAIDFIKELEQLLQSLTARKQRQQREEAGPSPSSPSSSSPSSPFNEFFRSPQYTAFSSLQKPHFHYGIPVGSCSGIDHGGSAHRLRGEADIEVSVVQTHVNLKVLSKKIPGQLLKAIAALEDLSLAVLHLNVTSFEGSVLYSFSLKVEEGCNLTSSEDIATAVHHIFSCIGF